jgi:hypothetical protein
MIERAVFRLTVIINPPGPLFQRGKVLHQLTLLSLRFDGHTNFFVIEFPLCKGGQGDLITVKVSGYSKPSFNDSSSMQKKLCMQKESVKLKAASRESFFQLQIHYSAGLNLKAS